MITLQPLPSLISGDLQGNAVLGAQLLQLSHDAGGDDGLAGGVKTVHECREERELVVDGVGEEVGIEEYLVGWLEGGVVSEEHGGWDLWAVERISTAYQIGTCIVTLHLSYQLVALALLLFLLLVIRDYVLLKTGISLANHALRGRELSRALCYTHTALGSASIAAMLWTLVAPQAPPNFFAKIS